MPAYAYRPLAQLVRYESVSVSLNGDEHYRAAMAQLEADDRRRKHPDFALNDLSGKSDEPATKVEPFVRKHGLSFPVLLDPTRTVNEKFAIKGIPKTFIYDRAGNWAAQAIDMRTQAQFLALLRKAGMQAPL